MENNKWLVCVQTNYNCVKYKTSDGDTKYPQYQDFLLMVSKYHIKNPSDFKKNIDSFKIIFINLESGDWEIVKMEEKENYSFEELLEINKNNGIKRENKMKSMVDKGKDFIFRLNK